METDMILDLLRLCCIGGICVMGIEAIRRANREEHRARMSRGIGRAIDRELRGWMGRR